MANLSHLPEDVGLAEDIKCRSSIQIKLAERAENDSSPADPGIRNTRGASSANPSPPSAFPTRPDQFLSWTPDRLKRTPYKISIHPHMF